MPALELSAPARVKRGETAALGVSFAAATPAANHVLHVDVVNPSGQTVRYYSGNLLAPEGRTSQAHSDRRQRPGRPVGDPGEGPADGQIQNVELRGLLTCFAGSLIRCVCGTAMAADTASSLPIVMEQVRAGVSIGRRHAA